ncbi:hypothetical protein [Jiangella gansuensis]|uniref:hypothetical protein n=1 Tax=Jiangella gansuensis TaxID=281473 RepID=UPI0004ADE180|nr:hypothetical protein [Jiangella gansuensis]
MLYLLILGVAILVAFVAGAAYVEHHPTEWTDPRSPGLSDAATARADDCTVTGSCEPGDHTHTYPCQVAW